jgi:hypothetical protein
MAGATRLSSAHVAQYCKRTLVAVLGCLCVTLTLASCGSSAGSASPVPRTSAAATAGFTPASSATPRSVVAFSCAAGGLPVTSGNTRTSCVVTTENGMLIVHATYTFTNPSQLVDETSLIAAGWMIAGLVNEDGGGSSGTWFLYLHQGAWISWGGATADGLLGVWAGVPENGEPIGCGRTLTGETSQHLNIPVPQSTHSVAVFLIAPFCLQDVESFYTTALTAAGWTADGPFQVSSASASGAGASTATATFTRNGMSVYLSLIGADGTPTRISIN